MRKLTLGHSFNNVQYNTYDGEETLECFLKKKYSVNMTNKTQENIECIQENYYTSNYIIQ